MGLGLALPFLALLIAVPADAGIAQPSEIMVRGPTLLCGEAFALKLRAGEQAQVRDSGMDFLTYAITATDGPFVLYEGNAPQPHDDAVRTGLGWPGVVAIHDNRKATAKAASRIRDRLLTGPARHALCKQK